MLNRYVSNSRSDRSIRASDLRRDAFARIFFERQSLFCYGTVAKLLAHQW